MSLFSWISTIISGLCFFWVLGLGLFALVRLIVRKVKEKKQMKEDLNKYDE